MKNVRVFLGGTCAETTWRDDLIRLLDKTNVDYFNPVVNDWTDECQAIEEDEKNNKCNVHLYVITPKMEGFFSIAEMVDSTYKNGVTTIVYFMEHDVDFTKEESYLRWTNKEKKSIDAICKMIKRNGGIVCHSLTSIVRVLQDDSFIK